MEMLLLLYLRLQEGSMNFSITKKDIDRTSLREKMENPRAGALVIMEGLVRNINEGKDVLKLEYEAYVDMALKEGAFILDEASRQFDILDIQCTHRIGMCHIGDLAVWVGVTAVHRESAFHACQYVIDSVKVRLPIWKKEYYVDGVSDWVLCEQCK